VESYPAGLLRLSTRCRWQPHAPCRDERVRHLALLDDQLRLVVGQVLVPVLGDDDEVLDADAADRWVVQAGFDGDDVARLKFRAAGADAGLLVDSKSESVPRAVDESCLGALVCP